MRAVTTGALVSAGRPRLHSTTLDWAEPTSKAPGVGTSGHICMTHSKGAYTRELYKNAHKAKQNCLKIRQKENAEKSSC